MNSIDPYRSADIQTLTAPRYRWWLRPICWLIALLWYPGHRWTITRQNVHRSAALMHLHHLAGCDAFCRRCGATWLDAEYLGESAWDEIRELRKAGGQRTAQVPPNTKGTAR